MPHTCLSPQSWCVSSPGVGGGTRFRRVESRRHVRQAAVGVRSNRQGIHSALQNARGVVARGAFLGQNDLLFLSDVENMLACESQLSVISHVLIFAGLASIPTQTVTCYTHTPPHAHTHAGWGGGGGQPKMDCPHQGGGQSKMKTSPIMYVPHILRLCTMHPNALHHKYSFKKPFFHLNVCNEI